MAILRTATTRSPRLTGSNNVGLGDAAGVDVGAGNNNIDILNPGYSADGTTDGSADPTTGPSIRIGYEGIQTQTFIAGIYGATTSDPTMNQAVVIDDNGNLGSVDVSSLTGPTGDTGPTGPSGAPTDSFLDTAGGDGALASLTVLLRFLQHGVRGVQPQPGQHRNG